MTASQYLAQKTPWAKQAAQEQQQRNKSLMIGGAVLVVGVLAVMALKGKRGKR